MYICTLHVLYMYLYITRYLHLIIANIHHLRERNWKWIKGGEGSGDLYYVLLLYEYKYICR